MKFDNVHLVCSQVRILCVIILYLFLTVPGRFIQSDNRSTIGQIEINAGQLFDDYLFKRSKKNRQNTFGTSTKRLAQTSEIFFIL